MNLLSVLAQVGFANVSKEQVREQIEANFTAKAEVQASVNTLLAIEDKYKELTEQVKAEAETARELSLEATRQLEALDVTEKDAITKMMELEAQKAQAESKLQASGRVIKALEDKKKAELIAELPNTFSLGLKANNQSYLMLGQITKIVNPFNIKLLTQVLADIDTEMREVDYNMHRVARETGASGNIVNGVKIDKERDFYTVMAHDLERALKNK